MKALSLKQPFAELILQGKKKIEIRKWNTKFRGEFLIHASKVPDKKEMERFNLNNLPTGKIVGKATLLEVKRYKDSDEFKLDQNKHMASEDYGQYGFILTNIKRINHIDCKGKLGFWNCDKTF